MSFSPFQVTLCLLLREETSQLLRKHCNVKKIPFLGIAGLSADMIVFLMLVQVQVGALSRLVRVTTTNTRVTRQVTREKNENVRCPLPPGHCSNALACRFPTFVP